MRVSEYLAREGIKPAALARRLGVPRKLVYGWAAGGIPRGSNLQKLIDGTKGPNGEPGVTLDAMLAARHPFIEKGAA